MWEFMFILFISEPNKTGQVEEWILTFHWRLNRTEVDVLIVYTKSRVSLSRIKVSKPEFCFLCKSPLWVCNHTVRVQHCVIIDADKSVLHCFIYHIDVEVEACQLELLLSTALQGRIILVLLTVSIVWAQSQGHTPEALSFLHSVFT